MEREYTGGLSNMLNFLFAIMLLIVFGKLFIFGLKATWGITKLLFTVVFLPLVLIMMVIGGLIYVALPLLLIIWAVAVFSTN